MGRSNKKKPKQKKSRRGGRARTAVRVVVLLGAAALLAGAVGLAVLWPRCSGADCPSVQALREYTPPQATRVMDRRGDLVAHLAPERRILVPLERIPAHVAGAFLAVEDKRFFQHDGIDYRRAVGALVHDLRTASFQQGFSTITMQLARNVFPEHLTRTKTLRRKLWEVVLAQQIEEEFSKDEILELYLNQIYLGNGLYGVEAAAQGYFGKSAVEIGPEEAAMLAALPKAPSTYDPRRNAEAALARRNLVLSLMADAALITGSDAARLRAEPLDLVPPPEAAGTAPFFVAAVRGELRERFGPEGETAGLRVFTTVDTRLQTAAARELKAQVEAIEAGEHGRYTGPVCAGAEPPEDPRVCLQGLFVAVDARTGDVLAMVGGRDFRLSQFNRVTQARRQAGSAFKPILYATALQAGIPVTTPLLGPGAQDYEGGYRPADHVSDSVTVNMRDALRLSSNRASVTLGEQVGVRNVVQTARTMGLSTPIEPYPSTFLGAADVIPLELVAAFTAFANGGTYVEPRLIRRIEDSQGRVIWEAPVRSERVLSAEAAFLTTNLMQGVVDHGTGWRVRQAGLPATVPAAGKTGTTNESADAWFVGVTPDMAAGVWIGFDQRKRIMAGAEGGKLSAPVWGAAMAEYYRHNPVPPPWIAPMTLVSAEVDRESGMVATDECPQDQVVEEWFIPGTEPREYCPLHSQQGVGGWLRRRVRDIGDLIGGSEATQEDETPAQEPAAREPAAHEAAAAEPGDG